MSWPMVSPLRQRMIDDIRARKLGRHCERNHIESCKRFAAFLKRSPETATPDDVRAFQLSLIEAEGLSICNRNRIMTGVKFLLKVPCAGTIWWLRSIISRNRSGCRWCSVRPRSSTF